MIPLICTQYFDPHADAVADELKTLGVNPFVLKRYEENTYFTACFNNKKHAVWICSEDQKVFLDNIGSIFWRVKPALSSEIPGEKTSVGDVFRSKEWGQTIEAIELLTADVVSINSGESRRKLRMKLYQKKLSLSCGLEIPETIISNSSDDLVKNFQTEDLVYKTLSSFFTNNGVIYTNKITKNDIQENSKSVFLAPGIFQAFIKKKHELRITIVGEKVFVAKIDSNRSIKTKIDWRYNQSESMFEPGELSSETQTNLLCFHKKAGLLYATYDFIVDVEGREIFLECNPGGQWLFLGDYLGSQITKEIAEYLLVCCKH